MKTNSKMVVFTLSMSIMLQNVNGSIYPIKRQRSSLWIILRDPNLCSLQKLYFKDTKRLHRKGCKNIDHAPTNQNKVDGKHVKKLEPPYIPGRNIK